jgi:hypothetical protein
MDPYYFNYFTSLHPDFETNRRMVVNIDQLYKNLNNFHIIKSLFKKQPDGYFMPADLKYIFIEPFKHNRIDLLFILISITKKSDYYKVIDINYRIEWILLWIEITGQTDLLPYLYNLGPKQYYPKLFI